MHKAKALVARWRDWSVAVSLLVILPGCALQSTNDDARSTTSQNGKAAVGTIVEYSDETFFELVKKYAVNDGESVDYAAWKSSAEDLSALQTQVDLIAAVSLKSHPDLFPTNGAAHSSFSKSDVIARCW